MPPRFKQLFWRILFSKTFIIAAIVFIVYTLSGFFLIPYLIGRYVPHLIRTELQQEASIGKVRLNPFLFIFEVNDFKLTEPDGTPVLALKRFLIDFESSSLFRWTWTFRQVRIDQPRINLVVGTDGELNVAKWLPRDPVHPKQEVSNPNPPRLLLQGVSIAAGEIVVTDNTQSRPATMTISSFDSQLLNISTLPNSKGSYSLDTTTGDGASLNGSGTIILQPFRWQGDLVLNHVNISTVWEFMRDRFEIDPPSGKLNVNAIYELDLSGASPQLTVNDLSMRLTGLSLKQVGDDRPFFKLKNAALGATRFDLARRRLEIGKISLDRGSAQVVVDQDGISNLSQIVRQRPKSGGTGPRTSTSNPARKGARQPWTVNIAEFGIKEMAIDYRDASRKPVLEASIDAVSMNLSAEALTSGRDTNLQVNDLTANLKKIQTGLAGVRQPAVQVETLVLRGGAFDLDKRALTFSRIGLEGGHIDLYRERSGQINLVQLLAPPQHGAVRRGAKGGVTRAEPWQFAAKSIELAEFTTTVSDRRVKTDGPLLTLQPLHVEFRDVDGTSPIGFKGAVEISEGGSIKARGQVDPSGLTVESQLEAAGVDLTPFQPYLDSIVNLVLHSGTLSCRGMLRYGIKAAKAALAFDGSFNLEQLRLTESGSEETFLGWQTLSNDRFKLRLKPDRVEVADVELVQPMGTLIIHADRSVNVAQVFKPLAETASTPSSNGPPPKDGDKPFPIHIRNLRIEKGTLDYADLSLRPPFVTTIHDLEGSISGISSDRNDRAQVQLEGDVEPYGLAKIDGEIDVFAPQNATAMSLMFRNIEMTRLSPYSGKFAGRRIDSGKLSLDLKYTIENGKLLGDNQIVVNRLQLGEHVESPNAVNLPLDLAVALLKDSKGVINIGLPVSGDLNNPQFNFGQLIGKALNSLLTKVVTAPFRVLGALIGGRAEEDFNAVAFEPGKAEIEPPQKEKLLKLAEALQQRPQLQLDVQGRFSPKADGTELKALDVRRALATRLGIKLEPGDSPGPVDFSSRDIYRVLEMMFEARFGTPALKKLKDSVQKEKAGAPAQLAKVLYAQLVESEPLPQTAFPELAMARAQAVVAELTSQGTIAAERVSIKSPKPVKAKEPVTVRLSLDVVRKPS